MSQDMDESFAYFFKDKAFGPAIDIKSVPKRSLEKFKGKLDVHFYQTEACVESLTFRNRNRAWRLVAMARACD